MPANDDLALLETAARSAGDIALSYFGNDPDVWMKPGDSPVTAADLAVNAHLLERLSGSRTHYGWLSEESTDDPARLSMDSVFVIDPIDGTRGFMTGSDDWTISLAVVERVAGSEIGWRPSVAVLFNPVRKELYTANHGGGARCNGDLLAVSNRIGLEGAQISTTKSLFNAFDLGTQGAVRGPYIYSLAYRIAEVAAGRMDAGIAKPNSHDWDLAAADLLLQEAGGYLTDGFGNAIQYNQAAPRHGLLVAGNGHLDRPLRTIAQAQNFVE